MPRTVGALIGGTIGGGTVTVVCFMIDKALGVGALMGAVASLIVCVSVCVAIDLWKRNEE